jgi:hypothetical protein
MTKCFSSSTEMGWAKFLEHNLHNGVGNHVHVRREVDDEEGSKPSRVEFS